MVRDSLSIKYRLDKSPSIANTTNHKPGLNQSMTMRTVEIIRRVMRTVELMLRHESVDNIWRRLRGGRGSRGTQRVKQSFGKCWEDII
jgi:hypothetical protein